MVQGVLIDEAIEMLFQCTSHFGRSTGTGTIAQALGALIGKAMDPLAEGGIGQRERIGDGVQAGAFDDFTNRLVVYLSPADKYHRLTRRLPQGQKGLKERAIMASQRPSPPW